MKNIFFLLILMSSYLSFGQDKNIAKVQKINGIEVYILCEPLRSYDVVMGKGNGLKWSSFISGGLLNESVSAKVSQFVKGVQKKAREEDIEFDAIIYTNGKNVSAIKFTDQKTPENDRLAEVQKMTGMPVFIMNEPLVEYKVEMDKGGGIKWKSMLTGGLVNNSIEQDINKYAGKLKRKFKKNMIDAILYSNGKRVSGIKFKDK